MNFDDYRARDATGLAELVRAGEVLPRELAKAARAAHDALNPVLNAVVEFYDDAERLTGPLDGPFAGVPFLRKDIGPSEAGRLQECGSRLMKGHVATIESHFTRRAKAGGLRYVGRSTTPEFAFSAFTESFLHGITRNPWAPDRTAGGSSGGAAAAVAAGIVPIAHASDGGGSIRIPSGWCGCVGLNPSRGRVSAGPSEQDGLFGLAREFVICRSVRDMAHALDVLGGPEPGEPFLIPPPERPFAAELTLPTPRLRIAIARTAWGEEPIAPEVLAVLDRTAAILADMGHRVEEIGSPVRPEDVGTGVIGAFSLGLADLPALARSLDRPLDATTLEPVMLRLLERTLSWTSPQVMAIFEVLRRMRHEVGTALAPYDLVLTPTLPVTSLPHGQYATTNPDLTAEGFTKADHSIFTFLGTFNVTGQPSVSLPLGQSPDGLPIGIQLVARLADEALLVRIARDLEEAMPWAGRWPTLPQAR